MGLVANSKTCGERLISKVSPVIIQVKDTIVHMARGAEQATSFCQLGTDKNTRPDVRVAIDHPSNQNARIGQPLSVSWQLNGSFDKE